MAMIRVKNLTFTYPGSYDPVFEDMTVQFDTGWNLGLVGRNGRGKTTFLRLLLGEYEYRGCVEVPVPLRYFPYPVQDPALSTAEVLGQVCPKAEDWQLRRELSLLEMDAGALERPFDSLSHGEQTKALLAALFLNEGEYLLIDEPTNHLDAAAREQVAQYLRGKQGFLLVCHDRRFLDACVDHILALNREGVELQSGNFSSWMQNFHRQQQFEQAQDARLRRELERLGQSARRTSGWSAQTEKSKFGIQSSGLKADKGYVGHKAAKMMKQAKVMQARQQRALEQKAALLKNAERTETLKLSPLRYHGETLAVCSQVKVFYEGRTVCGPLSFTVRRGQRLALTGPNGSGKSSLLALLLGRPVPHTGTVQVGSGLVISHVPQGISQLHGSLSGYAADRGVEESLFKAILRKLNFSRTQFDKDLSELSAGQRKQVLLATSLCEPAHLYVWDEPLNYLDVYSRMQVEQLLLEARPTMVFVEHDAVFRERIATQSVALEP